MTSSLAVLHRIGFAYGSRPVLHDLSLEVMEGECVVVSGSNGSGKTTLIKIVAGLLKPAAGSCAFGKNFRGRNLYLPGGGLYEDLSVGENLRLFGSFHRISRERWSEVISHFKLGDLLSRRPTELSRGQAARASLAQTFLADVSFYLLDEPTSGLDEVAADLLAGYVETCRRRGAAVLISSTGSDGIFPEGVRRYRLTNGKLAL